MSDVTDDGKVSSSHVRDVRESGGYTLFRDQDVLFAKITPCMENGKGALVDGLVSGYGFGSTEFHVLRSTRLSSSRFIGHWAQSRLLRQKAEAFMVGSAGQRRVPSVFFSRFMVPLLSLAEQCEIADVLDALDLGIDLIQEKLGKLNLMRLGQLNRLLFPDARPEWVSGEVQDFGDVRMGRQRSPKHEGGVSMAPYLRVANVFDGYIDYSDVLTMNFTPSEREIYGLRPGDILLNEGQSLDLVGRSAIYRGWPGEFFYQNTLVRYRCFDYLDPEFAQLVFHSWLKRGYFAQVAFQTTSIAHLGGDRFARMKMDVPPLGEQQRIVSIIRAYDERIAAEKAQLEKLRKLKAGLMDDLLTGRVRVNQLDELPV